MTLSSSSLEIKPGLKEQIEVNRTALEVREVSLIFPDGDLGLHVLADISFSVQTEEFLCILGPDLQRTPVGRPRSQQPGQAQQCTDVGSPEQALMDHVPPLRPA